MYSDNIKKQAELATTVSKLMRKREKLLEDQELWLQPTRGLVPGPVLPTTLGVATIPYFVRIQIYIYAALVSVQCSGLQRLLKSGDCLYHLIHLIDMCSHYQCLQDVQ